MKQPNQEKWLDGGRAYSIHPKGLGSIGKKPVDARHKPGHEERERS
jgi:hypothetical protein